MELLCSKEAYCPAHSFLCTVL